MGQARDFLINRHKLSEIELVAGTVDESTALGEGEATIRVDKFGLTANNITYAVIGEQFGYWSFFPCREGWGRLPVWGFGTVVKSAVAELAEGTRVYGFLPMSTHLLVRPAHVSADGFVDAMEHRSKLPAPYNHYKRVAADADASEEAASMLLAPLHGTGFLIDDYLAENGFFGANTLVVSSASSRTAIAFAYVHSHATQQRPRIVGLTSEGNLGLVQELGCYDEALTYDDVGTLPGDATVYVDIAGNATVTRRVHEHLGDALKHNCRVGVTHWRSLSGSSEPMPGPSPTPFFAPAQVGKRAAELGMGELQTRIGASWESFAAWASGWLEFQSSTGAEAVTKVYLEMLAGKASPRAGHILSLA